MRMVGTIRRLKPDDSRRPPRTEEDVVALVVPGLSKAEPGNAENGMQICTGNSSQKSFEIVP